jgi:hypothetical protein
MAKFDSLQDHEFRRDEWAAREQGEVNTQPTLDAGGEWRVDGIPSGTVARYVTDATGNYGIAFVYGNTQEEADQHATQIVAEHNAVGLLVAALGQAAEQIVFLEQALEEVHGTRKPNETLIQINAVLAAAGRRS